MILQLGAPAADLAVVVVGKCPCIPLETAALWWAKPTNLDRHPNYILAAYMASGA